MNSDGYCEYYCSTAKKCGVGDEYKKGTNCTGCTTGEIVFNTFILNNVLLHYFYKGRHMTSSIFHVHI